MKRFVTLFFLIFLVGAIAFGQTQYEVLKDHDGSKILKGIISRETLSGDSAFKWLSLNMKPYPPEKEAAVKFARQKDSLQLLVFLGTWCEDSHVIIPKLFSFLDATGFSNDRVTVVGVDRNKKTISHLTDALHVLNVPTIIVMKEGKELGRVVEYGRYGMIENELAEIADKK